MMMIFFFVSFNEIRRCNRQNHIGKKWVGEWRGWRGGRKLTKWEQVEQIKNHLISFRHARECFVEEKKNLQKLKLFPKNKKCIKFSTFWKYNTQNFYLWLSWTQVYFRFWKLKLFQVKFAIKAIPWWIEREKGWFPWRIFFKVPPPQYFLCVQRKKVAVSYPVRKWN